MKRICLIMAAFLAALLLSGCALRTVEDMYSLPKRPESYNHIQSAIDAQMEGLSYSAPQSGENQQTVQMADLTGDGVEEYLVFARSESEDPMRVLIFTQSENGCELMDTICCQGTAFDHVEYVDIDGQPGLELVLGKQLSNQLQGSVSVYSFQTGGAEQLLSAAYSEFLTCDLDGDKIFELFILRNGESSADRGVALLYCWEIGQIERSAEVDLSGPTVDVKRIMVSKLYGGVPAVYVASSADGNAIVTDVFAMKDGVFTNISFSNESGTSVRTLRNYYVYADDIDDDGILELPSLITLASDYEMGVQNQYLIRWFALDLNGNEVDKMYTFHNFAGGWYLGLDDSWATQLSLEQNQNSYCFSIWDSASRSNRKVFTVFALTGQSREADAVEDGKFVLYRTEGVIYAGKLESAAADYGITQENLINAFRLIQQDWNSGET